MSTKIKLVRIGKKKSPFYRIIVQDSRKAPTSINIEQLGTYDALAEKDKVKLNAESAKKWIATGAIPTETVADIFRREGILPPKDTTKAKPSVQKPKKKEAKKS